MSMALSDDAAELRLVMAAIWSTEALPDELDPAAFGNSRHRLVLEAVLFLRGQSKRPTANLIFSLLKEWGKIGGWSELELAETYGKRSAMTRSTANDWATVVDYHATRRVVAALADISGQAGVMGAEDLLGLAYEKLSALRVGRLEDASTIGDVVKGTLKDLHARWEASERGEGSVYGIPTGLADLDELMGGISEGTVTIVAGRPSHGKSSLTRTIADNANRLGCGVHVFSIEDRKGTYGMRLLADHARIDLGRLRVMKGVTRGELAGLSEAASKAFKRTNWLVDDSAGLTAAQIAMRIRRQKRTNQTRLVVVDYVQLIDDPRARDMKEQVGRAIKTLANVARDEGVAMVVLSQLSRDLEKREDKRPVLSDLRETGELEQVAESVVFIMQPTAYLDPNNKSHAEKLERWNGRGLAIVAKHKNSAKGQVELAWDAPTATYRDLDKRQRNDSGDWRDGY